MRGYSSGNSLLKTHTIRSVGDNSNNKPSTSAAATAAAATLNAIKAHTAQQEQQQQHQPSTKEEHMEDEKAAIEVNDDPIAALEAAIEDDKPK